MKTVQVFFYLKQQKKLYDDIFAFICHIRHCTSCDVTTAHANIAILMLKRYIVQLYLGMKIGMMSKPNMALAKPNMALTPKNNIAIFIAGQYHFYSNILQP